MLVFFGSSVTDKFWNELIAKSGINIIIGMLNGVRELLGFQIQSILTINSFVYESRSSMKRKVGSSNLGRVKWNQAHSQKFAMGGAVLGVWGRSP